MANPIGAQLKKAVLAVENAVSAIAMSKSATTTMELRKVAEANMSELRKVSEAMVAAMASGADDRSTGAKGRDVVDADLTY